MPDSIHWVLGTIAKSIVRFNPWIEGTIVSAAVLDRIVAQRPELLRKFDLVHFTCPYNSKRWLPPMRELMPCVTSHHHLADPQFWPLIEHNLEGDAIVVGSREWEEDLRVRGVPMERVLAIPYGVDAERFQPATDSQRAVIRRKLGLAEDAVVVGFFAKQSSNEDDRKGTKVFIQAIQDLHRKLPQTTALIIGPGWHDLVREFRAAGLHCLWFPFIRDNAGLAPMYHALDFYWVTARIEGGPVTLLEAMSSGVCCLTTPVGLAREIVEDGVNAVMVPIGDADGFACCTIQLTQNADERERLGCHARQTILEKMDLPVVTGRISELYARAFETFEARTGRPVAIDVRALAAQVAPAKNTLSVEVPLNGIPVQLRRRVQILENIGWAESLRLQGQTGLAWRIISHECLKHPFRRDPWSALLRQLLPTSLTVGLVRLKNRGHDASGAAGSASH